MAISNFQRLQALLKAISTDVSFIASAKPIHLSGLEDVSAMQPSWQPRVGWMPSPATTPCEVLAPRRFTSQPLALCTITANLCTCLPSKLEVPKWADIIKSYFVLNDFF